MASSEGLVPDLAGAVLDGTPIDWPAVESSADEANRPLLAQLRVLATLADLHRRAGNTNVFERHRERALALAPSEALRQLLRRRLVP